MKRWWLWLVAAVLGIGMAVLVIPRPDTGGDVAERPTKLPRLKGTDIPQPGDADWHPVLTRPGTEEGGEEAGRTFSSEPREPTTEGVGHGNPYSMSLAEARRAPHIQALTRSSTPWRQIARVLKAKPDDPTATEMAALADQLVDELREARRHPDDVDYDGYEARQQELIGTIRQTHLVDEDIERALAFAEQIMSDYRQGAYDEPTEPPTQP